MEIIWDKVTMDKIIWDKVTMDKVIWVEITMDKVIWDKVTMDKVIWDKVTMDKVTMDKVTMDKVIWVALVLVLVELRVEMQAVKVLILDLIQVGREALLDCFFCKLFSLITCFLAYV